jgi:hypothetical protein
LNKSAFQKLSLLKKSSSRCIHTKNVYILIDLPKQDEFATKITQHLAGCQVCQDEFEKYKQKQFAIKVLIPKPFIDNETKEIFENEVSEMFKAFDLNEKEFKKKQIKSKVLAIDSVGSSIVKHISSPKFLFLYSVGIGFYFILKKFS